MSKKIVLGIGTVLTLLPAFAVSSQAVSARPAPSRDSDDVQRFTVIARNVQQDQIDVGKAGPSIGDYLAFSENDYRSGNKVGTDGGTCTLVKLSSTVGTAQCLITVSLAKGDLTLQGLARIPLSGAPAKPFRLAITGGTRGYRTARGDVTATDLGNGDTRVVFHLIQD